MSIRRMIAVATLGFCVTLPVSSVAQNEKTTKSKTTKAKVEEKKTSVRLPNNYGKIDLTDQQKDAVKEILFKYNDQIDRLEAQIQSLKEKRDAETQKVLSPEQKSKLALLEAEAKKKKSGKSDKAEDKESADEK